MSDNTTGWCLTLAWYQYLYWIPHRPVVTGVESSGIAEVWYQTATKAWFLTKLDYGTTPLECLIIAGGLTVRGMVSYRPAFQVTPQAPSWYLDKV
jgi:hypothetical protein